MDRPRVGVGFSIFNMQRTGPTASRITDGVDSQPIIEVDESEEITVAVGADDLLEGDIADPERHPIAIALLRQYDVDDARVTMKETLVRRWGLEHIAETWYRIADRLPANDA